MSERIYRQFLSGDRFTVNLDLQRARAPLVGAGVVFRREGGDEFVDAVGTAENVREGHGGRTGSKRIQLVMSIAGATEPGVYRTDRVWVETVGGRLYEWEGEELEGLREFAFEVLEEPYERPGLRLSYG